MYDAVYVYVQRSLVVLGIINCTVIRACLSCVSVRCAVCFETTTEGGIQLSIDSSLSPPAYYEEGVKARFKIVQAIKCLLHI